MATLTFQDKQKTFFSRQKRLRENPTKAELIFKNKLDEIGIKYIFQKTFIQGDYYCIVDFYIPRPYKICIEIDGEYHQHAIQKYKDEYKDQYLINRKFKILRLSNELAVNLTPEAIKEKIENVRKY